MSKGPVAAAVDATTWNNYLGGVIQWHCGSAGINHAVEIVGYDLTGKLTVVGLNFTLLVATHTSGSLPSLSAHAVRQSVAEAMHTT